MSEGLTEDQTNELRSKLSDGRKIAAVKLYKEWTACSLLEAKHHVDALASPDVEMDDGFGSSLDHQVMDGILDAIQKGNKLEAVKLYKENAGVSLLESKTFVERLMSELGVEQSHRAGCSAMLLAVFVLSAFVLAGAASMLA